MISFCDIHHHCLYGLDDGAQSLADMEQMLHAAYRDYVDTLVVTPHYSPGLQDDQAALIQARIAEAQRYCVAQNYPISIVQGAEILYTPAMRNVIRDRALPALGDSRRVLVEFVPDITWREVLSAVALLMEYGYRPVIAHVERYRCLFGHTGRLRRLKSAGDILYQINCASILNPDSVWQRCRINRLLRKQLADVVATDAHNGSSRQTCMTETFQYLLKRVPAGYANALVSHTPRRILNGG